MPRNYSRLPWGVNHRKIPTQIEQSLVQFAGKPVVVACVKELTPADFSEGRYAHLDITVPEDATCEATSLLPSPNVGRTSFLNAVVEDVVRKNRGKVSKTIHGSIPSRDGWRRHPTKRVMQVWPKDVLLPAMSHLTIQRLKDQCDVDRIKVRFQVTEVLDPKAEGFRRDLLRCINLLLENVGVAEVFPLDLSEAEQLRRTYQTIEWEPLPGGDGEQLANAVFRKTGKRSARFQKEVVDRLAVLDELKPRRRYQGGGHFTTYLAAEFTDDLVILENLRVGAIYVMRGNWETLSRLTRAELLSQHVGEFIRIVHKAGWQARLKKIVSDARGEKEADSLL